MPRKGRTLRENEKLLWEKFSRQIKTFKQKEKRLVEMPTAKISAEKPIVSSVETTTTVYSPRELYIPTQFRPLKKGLLWEKNPPQPDQYPIGNRQPGLDNRSWKKLSSGTLRVERRLDLHGYTAQSAFIALENFLLSSKQKNIRCIEVITGIGSRKNEGGILKRELPFWLNRPNLRRLILGIVYSSHNNDGAIRILLKRNRSN